MEQLASSVASMPWFGWVAIVAVVCGTITKVVSMSHEHFERMAMIQQGLDPRSKGPRQPEV